MSVTEHTIVRGVDLTALQRALEQGCTVEPIGRDRWRVSSGTEAGRFYIVTRFLAAGLSCGCPAGQNSASQCKHRAAVGTWLLLQPKPIERKEAPPLLDRQPHRVGVYFSDPEQEPPF